MHGPRGKAQATVLIALFVFHGVAGDSARRDLESDYLIFRRRNEGVNPILRAADVNRAWAAFDWLPEGTIERHSPASDAAFDEALFRRAVSIYQEAARRAVRRQRELDRLEQARYSLPGGPWWKRMELGEALDRRGARVRRRGARSLADRYALVLQTLAAIRRADVRSSPSVRALRQAALRRGAIERLAVGETLPAMKLLEEYRQDPRADEEWPLHFQLARAYAATFRDAVRDRGVPEADLRALRRRYHLHLLRAVELRYGLHSTEYDFVWRRVRLEDLGSPRTQASARTPAGRLQAR